MPNTRGGKGYKKGKTGRDKSRPEKKLEIVNVAEGEGFYARIKKRLGGKPAKFEIALSNGTSGEAIARGKMHKKVWINPGMLVLINSGNEIIKVIRESDKDAKEAGEMMGKVENANSVFSTFFVNESSDDDDINICEETDSDELNQNSDNSQKSLNDLENPNKKRNNKKTEEESEENSEEYSEEEEEEDEEEAEGESEGEEKKENKEENTNTKKDKRNKKNYNRENKKNIGGFNIDEI
jgi:translation initiation factor IF-1